MKYRLAAISVLLLLAIGGQAVAQPRTLVFCSDASPRGFNPQLTIDAATFDASSRQLYNRLLEYRPGTADLAPALAVSWQVSEDGLVYTFGLRRGVRFHRTAGFTPGRNFNADDVVFSFERQRDRLHPFHDISGGGYPYFRGMGLASLLRSVGKSDDYTVVFTLTRPEGSFPHILAMDFASILSAEYAGKMLAAGTPEKLDREPVGTGPYQLLQYQTDALIRYVAHPGYWAGKAPLDNLVFAITPDASVRVQKLRDGECQIVANPDPADIPVMQGDPDITLLSQTGPDVSYLAFNTARPPLDDRRVRAALGAAIDRQAILDTVFQGLGRLATGPVPPFLPAYNESVAGPAWDPVSAREVLREAGVTDLKIEIWPMPVYRAYMPNARRAAEMIREDWLAIGVQATIVNLDWKNFLKLSMEGEHQVVLFGWTGENLDPENFLYPTLSCAAAITGSNRARWCFAPFDRLLQHARATANEQERGALYREAQRLFAEQSPWIPLAHSIGVTPVRAEVTGYRTSPLGGHYFYGTDLR